MPRPTTPTPREMRALEDAAAPELAAGVREVERGKSASRPHVHTRDCYDDAGPGAGGLSLICGMIEGDPDEWAAVEPMSFAERREIVATLRRIKAHTDAAERSRAVREDLAISPDTTEADLARAWTAADPPAVEPAGEEEPC